MYLVRSSSCKYPTEKLHERGQQNFEVRTFSNLRKSIKEEMT